MASSLDQYIKSVRDIVAKNPGMHDLVSEISQASADLIENPPVLTEEQLRIPECGYARNLLYKDEEQGWVVVAMVWPPGFVGPPHDHGVWGVVAVTQGNVRIVNYKRTDDGSDPQKRELVERDRIEAGPGAVATVEPPEADWHLVGNASEECTSISIHTYGADLKRCRAMDLDTGAVRTVDLIYANS